MEAAVRSLSMLFCLWTFGESTSKRLGDEGSRSGCRSRTRRPVTTPAWASCTAWCATGRAARARLLPNEPSRVWWKSWKRRRMNLTRSSRPSPPTGLIPASAWPSSALWTAGFRWVGLRDDKRWAGSCVFPELVRLSVASFYNQVLMWGGFHLSLDAKWCTDIQMHKIKTTTQRFLKRYKKDE